MTKLADFISKQRAHLSKSRFVPEYQKFEEVPGVRRLTAEHLGRVLLDYLNVFDDFIGKLPDIRKSGKQAWLGAASNARYKTEVAFGLRESDYPESLKPLMPGRSSPSPDSFPRHRPDTSDRRERVLASSARLVTSRDAVGSEATSPKSPG